MNSLQCLVIGDNHFGVSNLLDVDAFITKVEVAIRRTKPALIVCLGDILDRHEMIHMDPLNRAVKFLALCASYAPTFALIGNHDRRNNSDFLSEHHPFQGMKHWPNLTIVSSTVHYQMKCPGGAICNLLFVPYVAPGRFYEALEQVDLQEFKHGWRSSEITAIFAHQEFKGVHMGAIKSEVGDEWDISWPLVISGHIHDYHLLQANLIYVGTPMQQTFSEKADKAVTVFDFNLDYNLGGALPLEQRSWEQLVAVDSVRALYARIDLRLRIKRCETIRVAQVATYQARNDEQLKLIIKGSASELRALAKSKALDNFSKVGVKFSLMPDEELRQAHSDPDDGQLNRVEREVPYLERFRELIQEDSELLPVFDSLFASA